MQRLQVVLLEGVTIVVEAEWGWAQALVEAQRVLADASVANKAEEEAKARVVTMKKRVTKLEGKLCHVLKAKEEGPFRSGAPMLVLTNVLDAVLREYLSNMTFKSRVASNHSYICDVYRKVLDELTLMEQFEDIKTPLCEGPSLNNECEFRKQEV
ncbi:hypothetical protein ACLOJK_019292 [Asimina triloba]